MNALHGHVETVRPFLRHLVSPRSGPASERVRIPFHDPVRGDIALTARIGPAVSDDTLVVVHGLGGHARSPYTVSAVEAATAHGLGCVRMNMRGADRSGDDVYHGGLVADLDRLVRSSALARARRIHLLGYSLGGHLVLAYAAAGMDPRVRSVASVCAPLDFEAGAARIDRPEAKPYREYLLRGLREVHAAASRRGPIGVSVDEARRIRTIRAWDDAVIAPRFGFRDAGDYYAQVSVGPRLAHITVPTLMVVADHDPMVKLETLLPSLSRPHGVQVVRTGRGGHVGFPRGVDLGLGGGAGASVEQQIVGHLLREGT